MDVEFDRRAPEECSAYGGASSSISLGRPLGTWPDMASAVMLSKDVIGKRQGG
jgi:hypothetical protein